MKQTVIRLYFFILTALVYQSFTYAQCNSLSPWNGYYGVWGPGVGGGNLTPANIMSNGIMKVPANLLITNDTNNLLYATGFRFRDTVCITDNFTFETRIRNADNLGGVSAYDTRIEILGSGMNAGASLIDISEISWAQPYTSAWVGGTNISNQLGLMVDLQNWSVIKMEFNNGTLHYYRDGVEFFNLPYTGNICNIYGFNYGFKGSGEIDWIRLTDSYNNVVYFEDFNDCNNFATFPVCNSPLLTTTFIPPSCSSNTLSLQTSASTNQPLQFNWTGPNGFTSAVPNPSINSPTISNEGTYIVTATSNYCNPPIHDTIVVQYPNSYQSSNQTLTVCQGGSAILPGGGIVTTSGTYIDTVLNNANIRCYDIFTTSVTIDNSLIDAGADQSICLGNSTQLFASGNNILSYQWYPSSGLSNTTIANPIANPTATTTYHITSQIRIGTNLVNNGDFSQGNTGFNTGYTYFPTVGTGFNQGNVTVANNPSLYNTGFTACGDHTTGNGNMLLVDGACGTNGVNAGTPIWCQTIAVIPNTDYAFSAWLTNVANNAASSTLNFSINGVSIGTPIATVTTACQWDEFYVLWNSGNATTANICITEGTGVCGGNDFAVDDISFYQICTVTDSVTVRVSNPSITISDSSLVNCFGGNDGQITAQANNGILPYSYTWTNTSQTGSTIQQLTANTYTVTATDSIGCTASRSVVISQPTDIVLSQENIGIAGCYGAADGSATFSATGGIYPYSWAWDNGENDSIASQLNPGTHTVTVTDAHNCSKSATVTIQGEASPVANFTGQNTCQDHLSQFINQSTITAPNTIASASWTVFNSSSSTPSTNFNFEEILPDSGIYNVQLIVVGDNGCADTITQTHHVYPNPIADFTSQSICYQVNEFSDSSTNYAGGNLLYFWDINNDGQMDYYTKTFSHTYPTANPQMVKLRVEDANGCYDTITKLVYVTQNSDTLQVPNILVLSSTQNNDKLDFEQFAPDFNQCISYSLYIYNRWGNLVFETKNDKNNPDVSCDFCFQGKTQSGNTLSAGTYFYVIQGEKDIIRKGSITIFD